MLAFENSFCALNLLKMYHWSTFKTNFYFFQPFSVTEMRRPKLASVGQLDPGGYQPIQKLLSQRRLTPSQETGLSWVKWTLTLKQKCTVRLSLTNEGTSFQVKGTRTNISCRRSTTEMKVNGQWLNVYLTIAWYGWKLKETGQANWSWVNRRIQVSFTIQEKLNQMIA